MGSKKSRRPNRTLASVRGLSLETGRFSSKPSGMSRSENAGGKVSLGKVDGPSSPGPLASNGRTITSQVSLCISPFLRRTRETHFGQRRGSFQAAGHDYNTLMEDVPILSRNDDNRLVQRVLGLYDAPAFI